MSSSSVIRQQLAGKAHLRLAQVPIAHWDGFYKPLWLVSAFVNSGYSYFWDLERDWEIQAFTARSGEAGA